MTDNKSKLITYTNDMSFDDLYDTLVDVAKRHDFSESSEIVYHVENSLDEEKSVLIRFFDDKSILVHGMVGNVDRVIPLQFDELHLAFHLFGITEGEWHFTSSMEILKEPEPLETGVRLQMSVVKEDIPEKKPAKKRGRKKNT